MTCKKPVSQRRQAFLQFNNSSGIQIIDSFAQCILQYGILFRTCAVAGKIPGGEFFQLMHRIAELPARRIHPDKMEPTEKDIRLEPTEDIQHTLVGAAADAIPLARFLDEQVLLMQVPISSTATSGVLP